MISLLLGIALFVVLLGTHECSTRAGRKAALRNPESKPELGSVGGALLGLLGLLLAFSFSSAAERFLGRQDLIVREANALGTAWLRTAAFPSPQRDVLRERLVAYTDSRVALGRADTPGAIAEANQAAAALQPALWAAAVDAADAARDRTLLILPALNEVIDLHTTRSAAMRRHHRPSVLAILGVATLTATALLGYSAGMAGRRHPIFQAAFALLAASVLWVTIDLDYPGAGLIRTDQRAMIETRASMVP